MSYRSQSNERSRSPSISNQKTKKKYSRSRSRSRSQHKYRSSKYRSRSRSPGRSYKKKQSRSYSRSLSYSPSHYSRGRRTHSRSPMSNRRRHAGSRDNPEPNRCLGVFGLNIHTTEHQIYNIFTKYGPVDNVQIIIDAKTGQSRGFGFVYFENYEDAKLAKEKCSGMEIDGFKLRVDFSITQRAHTPTPGIYMGKPTYSHDRYRKSRNYGDYYGGGGGYRGRRNRSPSPYYYSRRSRRRYDRYERSRSRSYSPIGYGRY